MTAEKHQSNYRIGAVSRLTGIPPDTLRVWERRYDLVAPMRSEGGGRLYSQEDVTRLSVIKRLVDSGHAIGTIAELSLDQLHERLAETRLTDRGLPASRSLRLAIVGATLPQRLRTELGSEQVEGIEPVGSYRHREDLLKAEPAADVDVLLVELPTLDSGSAADIRELTRHCGATRTLVVFGFGTSDIVAQLERSGIVTLRFPVTWEEVRVLAGAQAPRSAPRETTDLDAGLTGVPPDRIYDDRELARAAVASTAIKCECPHHLADLILSLCHFEEYSARCESRNRDDAALHAYLHVTTARARNLMEQALGKVIEVEGIDLDDISGEMPSEET
jgi:MerR family transcriptional regulator, light-induced transcriptional regulator